MPDCGFSLPCSQSSTSDPTTHKYTLEIICMDAGNAIVGNCQNGSGTGTAIWGMVSNPTNDAIGIAVQGTAQLGPGGQFNSGNIGVQASGVSVGVQANASDGNAFSARRREGVISPLASTDRARLLVVMA
jgi:hypothetical protein